MTICVQKFGGTSLQTDETKAKAVEHVEEAVQKGYKVVTVVSAMGRLGDPYATDTLLSLIGGVDASLSKREQDLLMACGETISAVVFSDMLQKRGLKSLAISGKEAGFRTSGDYSDAKIVDMNPQAVMQYLDEYDVIVVTGFQGETANGTTATLGRGGSDTSATALGAALDAEVIDIFTDVDGIMTADPRLVEDAKTLDSVTYNEICNMAYQGAKVIHPRAVEVAMQAKVPIRIRSIHSKAPGTLISVSTSGQPGLDLEEKLVTGITHVGKLSRIKVSVNGMKYEQSKVFETLAEAGISVDFIHIHPDGAAFTVPEHLGFRTKELLTEIGLTVSEDKGVAKVSAVGAGMTGVPGVTSKIVKALSDRNITILQSADSHTTIWVLVYENQMKDAVNALHDAFI
ncbi:aspartate kinase [Salisediminibacterium beveridgei]|uniref:Aspartokinase n=1 Tax=Salisediminibacterium beveridgei TaxID=632773 RepID=A0A1D7QVU2_9BACI|nr:aspartate kinase [Salisediminibacterium beveridgei]AOM83134.1 Aspartokinase [Salisediminibacterium beveridgei]